jgi:hypothetical protein
MAQVKADLTEMYKLMRMLKEDYTVRVGILGSKATKEHKGSDLPNADIGTFHEFGTKNMPQRSFLMMPIGEKLNFNADEMKDMRKFLFKQLFIKKAPQEFYKGLLSKALEIVNNAFATGGFGEWKPLSDITYARRSKKLPQRVTKRSLTYWFNHPILTDTGQLRRSISGKIIKGK